jgi:hypothetical protein
MTDLSTITLTSCCASTVAEHVLIGNQCVSWGEKSCFCQRHCSNRGWKANHVFGTTLKLPVVMFRMFRSTLSILYNILHGCKLLMREVHTRVIPCSAADLITPPSHPSAKDEYCHICIWRNETYHNKSISSFSECSRLQNYELPHVKIGLPSQIELPLQAKISQFSTMCRNF